MDKTVLRVFRGEDGLWWFEHPVEGEGPMGPYRTRAECEDDKRGVERLVSTKKWRDL